MNSVYLKILNYIHSFLSLISQQIIKIISKYKNKIENNEHSFDTLYDFTESTNTDLSFLLKKVKQQYKHIKNYEVKFFHDSYVKSWEKKQYSVSPFNILFYDKTQSRCLTISESHVKESKLDGTSISKDIKHFIKNKNEEDKIKQIFQELKNDFKLYTKDAFLIVIKHHHQLHGQY